MMHDNPAVRSAHAGFLRICGIDRFRAEMGREPTDWELAEVESQNAVHEVRELECELEKTHTHLAVLELRLERARQRMAMKIVEREEAALAELAANAPTPDELMAARINTTRPYGVAGDEVVFAVPNS